MNYKVYDSEHNLINTIYANEQFIEQYCKVNNYAYELLEEPQVVNSDVQLDPQADTDAMMVDHEYRLTLLELGINE